MTRVCSDAAIGFRHGGTVTFQHLREAMVASEERASDMRRFVVPPRGQQEVGNIVPRLRCIAAQNRAVDIGETKQWHCEKTKDLNG